MVSRSARSVSPRLSLRMLMLPLALGAACVPMVAPMTAFAADASIDQVYATAKGGNVPGALTMMDQVLKDHPNSAKAHYMEAELLQRSHRAADARAELAKAETLAPGLPFASAHSQAELRAALGAGNAAGAVVAPAPAPAEQGSHISFSTILIIGLVIFGLLAVLRRRSVNQYSPPMAQGGYPTGYGPQGGPGPGGYGAGYGPGMGGGMMGGGMMGGGMGGGIMGGLASGAAMGAGLAVGEEVVGHMFGDHERRGDGLGGAGAGGGWEQGGGDPNADMGGSDFGISGGGWDDGGSGGGGDGGW